MKFSEKWTGNLRNKRKNLKKEKDRERYVPVGTGPGKQLDQTAAGCGRRGSRCLKDAVKKTNAETKS